MVGATIDHDRLSDGWKRHDSSFEFVTCKTPALKPNCHVVGIAIAA